MEPNATSKATIASLISEIHAIHSDNSHYWRCDAAAIAAEKAAHYGRQDRLQEIRATLELQVWSKQREIASMLRKALPRMGHA